MMQEMMDKMKMGSKDESKPDPKMELAMSKIEELKGLAEGMGMSLQELVDHCEEYNESSEEESAEPMESEEGKGNMPKARMIVAQLALRKPKGE